MRPHQGSVEGKENLPPPASHTLLDAPQDPIGFLGSQGRSEEPTRIGSNKRVEAGGRARGRGSAGFIRTVQMQTADSGFFACFSVACVREGLCTESLDFTCTAGATGRAVGCLYVGKGKATEIPEFGGGKRGVKTKVVSCFLRLELTFPGVQSHLASSAGPATGCV